MSSSVQFSDGKSLMALPFWNNNEETAVVVNWVTFGIYDKTDVNKNFVCPGK